MFVYLAAHHVNAQIAIGGKAGLNISNVVANQSSSIDENKLGFNIGVVGSMGIGSSGRLFGVGELNFNQKGGKNMVSGANSLGYIELAALIRYVIGFGETVPFKMFLNVGPYVGFKTGRKADTTAFSSNIAEFGVGGGGGLIMPAGPGNLFLEVRYNIAVTNMVSETLERNTLTSISVGYLYTLKEKTSEVKDKDVKNAFE